MEGDLPKRFRARFDPAQRYGVRLTLFAGALLLAGVPFGLLLDQVVRDGPLVKVDTAAANHLHELVRHSPLAVDALEAVSFLGKPVWFYVVCIPAGVFLLRRGHVHLAVYLWATSILAGIIDTAVKVAVDRDRPSLEEPVATAFGQSFPSGHAMSSTVVYGALLLIFLPLVPPARRALAVGGAVLLVAVIGFTRLALGVHYISDVLGGYALGLAWLLASTAAFEIWREERGLRRTVPLAEGVEPEAEPDLHPLAD
jgi:membrane-associated phospholipid phosphatase